VIFYTYITFMTQPPIQITGSSYLDWALLVCAFLTVAYYLKAIRLARSTIRYGLKLFLAGFLCGLAYYLLRGKLGGDAPQADGVVFGVLALVLVPRRKRSRYIPVAVRRKVIARDLKGGQEYDPQKHHFDHKWAFSRGGGHTSDNLRVIEKDRNLRKGAKKPGIVEMFFR
jgi:hypothetical protein